MISPRFLLLQARQDEVVVTSGQDTVCAATKACQKVTFGDAALTTTACDAALNASDFATASRCAGHELLMERDGIRGAVEAAISAIKARHIPMNIDGITAVIFCELGFEPELGRGLFVLSRSVGILAHAWEQKQRGRRIMGPMPREIPYRYSGPARRDVPPAAASAD